MKFNNKTDSTVVLQILIVCSFMSIGGCNQQPANSLSPEQAQAVAALEALGAEVKFRDGEVAFIDFYPTRDIAAAIVHLKPFVEVKKLNFSSSLITDEELVQLTHLTNLEELALKGTKVTDAGLQHIAGLNKLLTLNLDDCSITDAGLVHLKGMTNLKKLHVNKTKISDSGLVHLAGLENLEWLLAYGTQVTPAGADLLHQSLPDLEIVAPKIAKEPAAVAEEE